MQHRVGIELSDIVFSLAFNMDAEHIADGIARGREFKECRHGCSPIEVKLVDGFCRLTGDGKGYCGIVVKECAVDHDEGVARNAEACEVAAGFQREIIVAIAHVVAHPYNVAALFGHLLEQRIDGWTVDAWQRGEVFEQQRARIGAAINIERNAQLVVGGVLVEIVIGHYADDQLMASLTNSGQRQRVREGLRLFGQENLVVDIGIADAAIDDDVELEPADVGGSGVDEHSVDVQRLISGISLLVETEVYHSSVLIEHVGLHNTLNIEDAESILTIIGPLIVYAYP